MIIYSGNIYLEKEHIELLKTEPEYVKKRYSAIARALVPPPFKIVYEKARGLIGVCLRHFYRILKRFREEGIPGLRLKSTRPKKSPNWTPKREEDQITAVRKRTGFGPNDVAALVNESNRREGKVKRIWPSTVYNILVREGEIEREHRIQREWKHFEWGHPNSLIQADLTGFNGVNILAMEDDYGRKGWALGLKDAEDETVAAGMRELVRIRYDNLLTDNGSQFSRKNSVIRRYCEECINEKHIWSSVHHPQTLGKLSAYQKGLKRFLRHKLGQSRDLERINYWIGIYNHWYNNGRYHSAIGTYPEERYSGKRDDSWYENLIGALKLEDVLTL
jgi:transposase InsO family protein